MADYNEKRATERFPVGGHVTCAFASPVLEDFGPVKIKNISTTGVGLIAPQVLDPGMLLAIKLVNPAKKFSKTALARVVHVTPQAGETYLVGCNLDTPLTYEELCILVM
jgi:PilZ domain